MAEFRFSTEPHGDSVVVSVRGELDITSSQAFDDCLAEASAGRDRVILDMSAVDFMDTSALAVIVGRWRRQVAAGGTFVLAGARYRYVKALWITGLAGRLPMYDTVAGALAGQHAPGQHAPGQHAPGQHAPGAGTANGPGAGDSSEGEPEATAG